MAYGNGKFVAVGSSYTNSTASSAILTSEDAVTWISHDPRTSDFLTSVAYGNGTFVAVSRNLILASRDGETWMSSLERGILASIAFGNGTFVAVGGPDAYAEILNSTNGFSWTKSSSGIYPHLSGITFGNGTFVAVGYGGTVLSSIDGIRWTKHPVRAGWPLTSVTYGEGTFLAAGQYGTILQSGSVTEFCLTGRIEPTRGFSLIITGQGNRNYEVKGSEDLVSWNVLGTVTNHNGFVEFLDPTATNLARRFYRAVTP